MNNIDKPTKIVKDKEHKGLCRLKWADGVFSEDLYNLTRAKDILKNYDAYRYNMTKRTEGFDLNAP